MLLKSVALAIPVYNMSVLKLPKDTNNQIDKSLRMFWWEEYDEKRQMHTIRWKEICNPINEGGLGIKNTESNNLALLAKKNGEDTFRIRIYYAQKL